MTRRVGAAVLAAAALAAASITSIAHAALPSDALPDRPESFDRATRVTMVADSVGLGARTAVPAAFPAGWSVAVEGTPAMFVEMLEATYVTPRGPGYFGDHAVIAGGYNYPYWDPPRFDRSIDSIITALQARGVQHVYWVTLREVKPQYISAGAWRQVQPYYWYFPTVNDHLEAALARHPNLTLVDWAAHADQPGLTYDAIHLNATGAALYASLIRQAVDASTQRVTAGSVTRIAVPDAAGTAAVALNLTTTAPRTTGYLTAYPCGDAPPSVSNHNHVRDEVAAHAAIVPVGADGDVCVYSETDANLIVDITGRFPAGEGIVPIDPARVIDTRPTRQTAAAPLRVDLIADPHVPDDATAVALSVTAVGADAPGFVAVGPCDAPPSGTSSVNFGVGVATPNVVVVAPDSDGAVCITPSADVALLVDAFAAFTDASDVALIDAVRAFDSRTTGAKVGPGSTTVVDVVAAGIDPTATGVLANVTATGPDGAGHLTVYPCAAGLPEASNLNTVAGRDVANFVAVQPDADGHVCVYSSVATHLLVDVLGSAAATFVGSSPRRLLDTRG